MKALAAGSGGRSNPKPFRLQHPCTWVQFGHNFWRQFLATAALPGIVLQTWPGSIRFTGTLASGINYTDWSNPVDVKHPHQEMVGHVAFEYAPISLHEEAEVQFIRHVQFTSFWIATMRIKGQQTTKLLRLFWFPRHCCCGPQVIEKPERIMLLFNPHLISLQKCLIPSQEL